MEVALTFLRTKRPGEDFVHIKPGKNHIVAQFIPSSAFKTKCR